MSNPNQQARQAQRAANKQKRVDKRAAAAANPNSFGNVMGSDAMSGGLDALNSLTSGLSASQGTQAQAATREGIKGALSQAGPWGAAVAAATGVVDAIGEMTGLNLDTVNKASADRLGVSTAGNDIINSLPGVSMLFGAFTPKNIDANKSHEIEGMSNAFGGSTADITAAGDLAGKRMLGSTLAANEAITAANKRNLLLTDMSFMNKLRKSNSVSSEIAAQNNMTYSGFNMNKMQIGKEGIKIFKNIKIKSKSIKHLTLSEIDINNILKLEKIESGEINAAKLFIDLITKSTIEKFQSGGKVNIIPTGALHARKNNLNEIDEKIAEDVTTKGIPVVITDKNSNIKQIAEIEIGELILTKEITDELEKCYKDGSEKAMIKAGKILTEEIMEYTEDLTDEILNLDED